MKKLISLILTLCMTLSLAACGGGSSDKVMLKILDTEYAVEDYAICIAKENTELLNQINDALATLTENGTAKAIVDQYISGTKHNLTFQQNAEGKPELHMATEATFPPYEYYEDGKIVGLDVDMAMAIADELDMKPGCITINIRICRYCGRKKYVSPYTFFKRRNCILLYRWI